MEDEPFPAKDILKVGFEIAKGLKYLHNTAHILHGDIKSWNILVSHGFNIVKLCDFGSSAPLTESLEMDISKGDFRYVGTECWNPPEIVSGTFACLIMLRQFLTFTYLFLIHDI